MVYLLGAIIFGIFASGETQPWAADAVETKEKHNNHEEAGYDNPALVVEKL